MIDFFTAVGAGVCGVVVIFIAAIILWLCVILGYPFCVGFASHLWGSEWREIRRMTFSQKRCRVAAVRDWSRRRPFRLQPCRVGVGRRVRLYWAMRAGIETALRGY